MSDSDNRPGGGLSDEAKAIMAASSNKSTPISYILWFFLGGLGVHRFYLGRIGSGLGMLALLIASFVLSFFFIGVFGYIALTIWWIVDAFLIPGMVRSRNEAV
ncbi:MAG: TM2 domain-containing protein [Alphaproteobacteria bacterium]|nr:TM2 domain-containing protein [Alphaproteobacteria bacterium]